LVTYFLQGGAYGTYVTGCVEWEWPMDEKPDIESRTRFFYKRRFEWGCDGGIVSGVTSRAAFERTAILHPLGDDCYCDQLLVSLDDRHQDRQPFKHYVISRGRTDLPS
jgi:hypothetical protein